QKSPVTAMVTGVFSVLFLLTKFQQIKQCSPMNSLKAFQKAHSLRLLPPLAYLSLHANMCPFPIFSEIMSIISPASILT
ncbi:MAG: hypothetical protein RR058_08525, partial [Oscillospiraceae bacterium]